MMEGSQGVFSLAAINFLDTFHCGREKGAALKALWVKQQEWLLEALGLKNPTPKIKLFLTLGWGIFRDSSTRGWSKK
ncbi:MAG: hypothetical protein AMJ94_15320 [Deltaproteobacteria bacterium SM23_61]|nr:MAG: hypothetical protein AMJ94_15320 [Deltaproteobacteria bacterium SM23_61]